MMRLLRASREAGVVLELNASPGPPGPDGHPLPHGTGEGCELRLTPMPHATGHFANLRYGVDQARRGWLTREDVVNTRPLDELRALLVR